jgi:hypothetical protein
VPHEEYPSRATRRLHAGHDEHFAADGDAANAASAVTAADTGAWGRLTIRTLRFRLSTVYP